ncbi:MAG: ribosomal-processing cysteine protease Prp [Ruminococcaceae bacterium]|nr:ribosomal-processing cysteine protease Prp [Oscillospiraceae bacterium]
MIRATFFKDAETCLYTGFNVKGHSGYAEAGSDIVCASVSSMVMLFVNMADSVFEIPFDFSSDEKKAEILFSVTKTDNKISKAIECFSECIRSVADEYPDFVKVMEKDYTK